MGLRTIFCISAILVGPVLWLIFNLNRQTNYDIYNPNLGYNNSSKNNPILIKDLLNYSKILFPSQDYIRTTTPIDRLYDKAQAWNIKDNVWRSTGYDSKRELHESSWPIANKHLCAKHLEWIVDKLVSYANFTHLEGELGQELTGLMGSFGRPEPAFHMAAATRWFGSYKYCTMSKLDGGRIKSRYCIGYLRYINWPQDDWIIPKTRIELGICLPESCDTSSFERHKPMIEFLARYELPKSYKDSLVFDSMYCLPDERSPLRQLPTSGRLYIMIVGIWIGLVILNSILYDNNTNNLQLTFDTKDNKDKQAEIPLWTKIIRAMSIQKSIGLLVSTNPTTNSNQQPNKNAHLDLRYLNCIKVIMSVLVIYGHSQSVSIDYTKTLGARNFVSLSYLCRVCLGFNRFIDAYFVLFGIYYSLKLLHGYAMGFSGISLWLTSNIDILIRTVPIYALTFGFSRSIAVYLGHGPSWDYGTSLSPRRLCMHEPWLRSIPYFGSAMSRSSPACNSPGWFAISYCRLALIVPSLLYVIKRLPNKFRFMLVAYLVLISNLNELIRIISQNVLDANGISFYRGFLVLIVDKYEQSGYQDTLSHLGSTSVGCLVSCLLYEYKLKLIQKWPNWLTSNKLTIIIGTYLVGVFSLPFIQYNIATTNLTIEMYAIWLALLKSFWLVIVAILIIRYSTVSNRHNIVIGFMSHPFWKSLDRIKMSIYLVHLEIIIYANSIHEHAASVDGHFIDVFKTFSMALSTSIVLALFTFTVFETPIIQLSNIIRKQVLIGNRKDHNISIHE